MAVDSGPSGVPVDPDRELDDPMAAAVLAEGFGESGAADDGDGTMLADAILVNPDEVGEGGFPRIYLTPEEREAIDREAAEERRPDYVASRTAGRAAYGEVDKEGGTDVDPPHDGVAAQAAGSSAYGEAADDGDWSMAGDAFVTNPGDVEHGGFPRIQYSQQEIDEMNRQAQEEARPDYVASQTTGRAAYGEVGKEGGTDVDPPHDGVATQTAGQAVFGEAGSEVGLTFVDPPHDGAASQAAGSSAVGEAAENSDDTDNSDASDDPDNNNDGDWSILGDEIKMDDGAATTDDYAPDSISDDVLGAIGFDANEVSTDPFGAPSTDATDAPFAEVTEVYTPDDAFAAPAMAESMPVDDWSAPAMDDPGSETDGDSAFSDF